MGDEYHYFTKIEDTLTKRENIIRNMLSCINEMSIACRNIQNTVGSIKDSIDSLIKYLDK